MYHPAHPIAGTRIPCYGFDSSSDVAHHVAQMVANTVRERNSFGKRAVLGLQTDSALVGVYRELIRMHADEGLDLSGVVTFNLTEYLGIKPDQMQSHHRRMSNVFLDHVNIHRDNIHILDGNVNIDEVDMLCRDFEEKIRAAGGIDLLLLGIGRNGRLGFNEPFGVSSSATRLATLDPITRRNAASDFFDESNVPTQALTMGIGTMLAARKIVVVGFGEDKAKIVREAVEEPVTDRVPASFLRNHSDASFLLDSAAADELTGVATPWLLGGVEWTDGLIKRAVLWLCEQTGKALLKLDGDDFRTHNLHQLLRLHGPSQALAHRVFKWMMDTIDYHPAGREPKRVLCFSPHPDDDVISMGGTTIRMVEDEHEVHVAYMTSGNIAVFDHDARQLADLLTELNRRFQIDKERTPALETRVLESLDRKQPGDGDIDEVLRIKGLIRWSEAKSAALVCGCDEKNLHFLDLPFYQTGAVEKKSPGEEDVEVVRRCIEEVDPGQVFVAGDLSDPHGTHRTCASIILRALDQLDKSAWFKKGSGTVVRSTLRAVPATVPDPFLNHESGGTRPEVLLYRGAWQEWAPHEIEIAVPLSPADVKQKKAAIFRHESQKDSALFPGPDDPREFWQRAEDRNRGTADIYNRFGLPEYYAMEAFVRWDGEEV
jgi:glucosamine-6-phosphate deaminase